MRFVDLTDNPRITQVLGTVVALSQARNPEDVLTTFSRAMAALRGPTGYISVATRNVPPGSYRVTRTITDPNASIEQIEREIRRHDPWKSPGKPQTGGLIGRILATPGPKLIHELDVTDDPVLGQRLQPYRSLLAIPLYDSGEPLNWAIMLRDDPHGFTLAEVEETILRSNLTGNTIRQTLLLKELGEAHEKLRTEVNRLARLQRALIPERLPHIPGVTMASVFETYDQAGGDLYDLIELGRLLEVDPPQPDRGWAILMADASGHGPAATAVAAMTFAIFRAFPELPPNPGDMLGFINRHLCEKRIEGTFVTALLAFFNPADGVLQYARAGHPPPMLKSPGPDGPVRRLDDVGDYPLGIVADARYAHATVQVETGQTILLYTDGVIEAADPEGQFFGVEGVEQALSHCSGEPECTVTTLLHDLRRHEAGVRPSDDQTLLAIKYLRAP